MPSSSLVELDKRRSARTNRRERLTKKEMNAVKPILQLRSALFSHLRGYTSRGAWWHSGARCRSSPAAPWRATLFLPSPTDERRSSVPPWYLCTYDELKPRPLPYACESNTQEADAPYMQHWLTVELASKHEELARGNAWKRGHGFA